MVRLRLRRHEPSPSSSPSSSPNRSPNGTRSTWRSNDGLAPRFEAAEQELALPLPLPLTLTLPLALTLILALALTLTLARDLTLTLTLALTQEPFDALDDEGLWEKLRTWDEAGLILGLLGLALTLP